MEKCPYKIARSFSFHTCSNYHDNIRKNKHPQNTVSQSTLAARQKSRHEAIFFKYQYTSESLINLGIILDIAK